jgi:hypothetical protein
MTEDAESERRMQAFEAALDAARERIEVAEHVTIFVGPGGRRIVWDRKFSDEEQERLLQWAAETYGIAL